MKNIYLVSHAGRLDYTTTEIGNPVEPVRVIKKGHKFPEGEVINETDRARRNEWLAAVGPTISLMEAHVKVSAHDVSILGGPWTIESGPGDDPAYPAMTGSIIQVGGKKVRWSNLHACYLIDEAKHGACLSMALKTALGA